MADSDGSEYTDVDRALLQRFLAQSVLTLDEARSVLAEILTVYHKTQHKAEDVAERDVQRHISGINNAISSFDMEIRSSLHQTNRKRIFALVNCASDTFTQLATLRSADEMGYVKRLLDAMFETHNTARKEAMALTSMQAVALAKTAALNRSRNMPPPPTEQETQGSSAQNLTLVQAEKTLQLLVDEGWFEKSRKGYYSLAPRALMELRGWLMETYNETPDDNDGAPDQDQGSSIIKIKTCYACKEIVTMGQRCSKRSCLCRFHESCVQRFFANNTDKRCPQCHTEWTSDQFVGEKAAIEAEHSVRRRRRSTNGEVPQGAAAESRPEGELSEDDQDD